MRLINIDTLEMEEFVADPPPYAILSHRWVGRETTYEDYLDPQKRTGPGFQKIVNFCRLVREDETFLAVVDRMKPPQSFATIHSRACSRDYLCVCAEVMRVEWVWIDTCCIDKRSSAELSEAINSMWNWYHGSALCVVYLYDVQDTANLHRSTWFSRGWTLQELLAPRNTLFYDQQWDILGARLPYHYMPHQNDLKRIVDLSQHLSEASGIPRRYLGGAIAEVKDQASIAQRMSWASRRRTTRKEDEAYCLFGLFGVNLPLLYGEGQRAFQCLQYEIARCSKDDSIFAWRLPLRKFRDSGTGLLASSPSLFEDSGNVVAIPSSDEGSFFEVTGRYVKIHAPMSKIPGRGTSLDGYSLLLLHCADCSIDESWSQCVLVLRETGDDMLERIHANHFSRVDRDTIDEAIMKFGAAVDFHPSTVLVRVAEPGMKHREAYHPQSVAVTGYKILYADQAASAKDNTQDHGSASAIWKSLATK